MEKQGTYLHNFDVYITTYVYVALHVYTHKYRYRDGNIETERKGHIYYNMHSRKISTGKADPDSSWTAINCKQKKKKTATLLYDQNICVSSISATYK